MISGTRPKPALAASGADHGETAGPAGTRLLTEDLVMRRTSTITELRSRIARRHAARADRLRLEHDLATYRTPAERRELQAIMARHQASDVAPLERIVSRQTSSAA